MDSEPKQPRKPMRFGRLGDNSCWHILDDEQRPKCKCVNVGKEMQNWQYRNESEMQDKDWARICNPCTTKKRARIAYILHNDPKAATIDRCERFAAEMTYHTKHHSRMGTAGDTWREKGITQKQHGLLEIYGLKPSEMIGWTRGKAADEIDRLKQEKAKENPE